MPDARNGRTAECRAALDYPRSSQDHRTGRQSLLQVRRQDNRRLRSPERIVAEHDNPLLEWAAAYAEGNEFIFVQTCRLLNIVPFWWKDHKKAYDVQRDPTVVKPISWQLNRPAHLQSEREKNQRCWDKLRETKLKEQEEQSNIAKHKEEQECAEKLRKERKAEAQEERQRIKAQQQEAKRVANISQLLFGVAYVEVSEPASQKVG